MNLEINYCGCQEYSTTELDYSFLLSDNDGKACGLNIPSDRAVAVLAGIIKQCNAKDELLTITCLYEYEEVVAPSVEDDLVKSLLGTWPALLPELPIDPLSDKKAVGFNRIRYSH